MKAVIFTILSQHTPGFAESSRRVAELTLALSSAGCLLALSHNRRLGHSRTDLQPIITLKVQLSANRDQLTVSPLLPDCPFPHPPFPSSFAGLTDN